MEISKSRVDSPWTNDNRYKTEGCIQANEWIVGFAGHRTHPNIRLWFELPGLCFFLFGHLFNQIIATGIWDKSFPAVIPYSLRQNTVVQFYSAALFFLWSYMRTLWGGTIGENEGGGRVFTCMNYCALKKRESRMDGMCATWLPIGIDSRCTHWYRIRSTNLQSSSTLKSLHNRFWVFFSFKNCCQLTVYFCSWWLQFFFFLSSPRSPPPPPPPPLFFYRSM